MANRRHRGSNPPATCRGRPCPKTFREPTIKYSEVAAFRPRQSELCLRRLQRTVPSFPAHRRCVGKGDSSLLLQRVPQEVAQPATPTEHATSGQSPGAKRTITTIFSGRVHGNIRARTTCNCFTLGQEWLPYGHRVGNSHTRRGFARCDICLTLRSTRTPASGASPAPRPPVTLLVRPHPDAIAAVESRSPPEVSDARHAYTKLGLGASSGRRPA